VATQVILANAAGALDVRHPAIVAA
jgi:hypothetical protein